MNDSKINQFSTKVSKLCELLFPIHRCITGNGTRETLKILKNNIDLTLHEIPTGTKVFDWQIPQEWNISDAYILNENNKKIVDYKKSNLHVLQYSVPIDKKLSLDELKKHLFTNSKHPDLIPYVTSYYSKNWVFCLSYNEFLKLKDETYHVMIDSKLKDGSLTYGELLIEGKIKNEILISTYVCHPSLYNDNLSGIVLTTLLAEYFLKNKPYYSIRFLFIPETIGSIAWLSINEKKLDNIEHGLVATCVGDSGVFTYKKTRDGDNTIDHVVEDVLINSKKPFKILDFWPSGSDERQYCSPGFNLPVGSLMRTPYENFEEYHTSGDNLNLMNPKNLVESLLLYISIINKLENYPDESVLKKQKRKKKTSKFNEPVFLNLFPKCEPHLNKRGLYNSINQSKNLEKMKTQKTIQWILNLSDGTNSINDIAKISKINSSFLLEISEILLKQKLLLKL